MAVMTKNIDRSNVKETKLPTPKTELGKKLFEIRQMIVDSGEKLLSRKELEQEIDERRK